MSTLICNPYVSFPDAGGAEPVITSAPTISGTVSVGATLTATPGGVTGSPTPTRTLIWYRGLLPIATGTTYVITSTDRGARLRVRQREVNSLGEAREFSALTTEVPKPAGTNGQKVSAASLMLQAQHPQHQWVSAASLMTRVTQPQHQMVSAVGLIARVTMP